MTTDIATITCAAFVPHVGTTFTLQPASGGPALEARLSAATEFPKGTPRRAPRIAFTLLFDAPAPGEAGNGCYALVHPGVGRIGPVYVERIFAEPATPGGGVFQVAFN